MCIVIYQPKGKQVQKAILQKAFENNPDGAGFMVQKDKEAPYMMKGFFDFDKFYKSYLPFSKGDYNVAIHFRIATHGTVNKDNCHPFKISSDIADTVLFNGRADSLIMHNGIISSIMTPRNLSYSDTMNFIAKILCWMKDLKSKDLTEVLENLESYSKFCIMRKGFDPILAGLFIEDRGIFYSNSTYKYSYVNTFQNCKTYLN